MSSYLWSSGIAVHAYRIRNPDSAIIKAIIDGSIDSTTKVSSNHTVAHKLPHLAYSLKQTGHLSKATAEETFNLAGVDDQTALASDGIPQTTYFSFPAINDQDSSKDADVASADKYQRSRKDSPDTTSTANSKWSENTAATADTEDTQWSIASIKNRRTEDKTPKQCDESGYSRDNDTSIRDDPHVSTYQSFPTLPAAPSSSGPRTPSPVPSDLACHSDIDDFAGVNYHSNGDFGSDSSSSKDKLDDQDLEIVHTLGREEYGLQYESEVAVARAKQAHEMHDENKEMTPKVKAVAASCGVEMITYYSDGEAQGEEEESSHPFAEFFCGKEQRDTPENWEVLAWCDHPDGNKSYVFGNDGRWYWEYEGAFMLLLDEELEDFVYWRRTDPAAVLILNEEVDLEEEMGLQNACGLETIQQQDEEVDEEIYAAKEPTEVTERNGLATVWGLDIANEEDEQACKKIAEAEQMENHQDQEKVWTLEDFEEVGEDYEDYKVFL
ncbi:hypothetical protein QBC45DRAFT_456945 [Copromyces sp. CBS 386.78]|nr:hypothetical protein QBC45DRAFT_456945 [Copromyces sp. CBS 386.78]